MGNWNIAFIEELLIDENLLKRISVVVHVSEGI